MSNKKKSKKLRRRDIRKIRKLKETCQAQPKNLGRGKGSRN